ncbi:DUF6933 domain-containing protein [Halobacillus sp. H74]|uniref:DUF6933 domain-containing protein n=1 Tax=Halobacillus sp. H74 TaxID=3457436 RepID=UPI003FCEC1E1
MFVIGATKKLQNELRKPIEDVEEYNNVPEIHQWHANIITLNRRKCLLLINNETGLNLTLFGLRKQQFEHLDSVIKGSLQQLFQLLEVDQEIADYMLGAADEIVYTKTKSRKTLGRMNEIKFMIESKIEGMNYEEIDAVEINEFCNNKLILTSLKEKNPYDTFAKYFEEK